MNAKKLMIAKNAARNDDCCFLLLATQLLYLFHYTSMLNDKILKRYLITDNRLQSAWLSFRID